METTARGEVPKTLQTIAYISIPDSADLEFLLWDLQDAIASSSKASSTASTMPSTTPVSFAFKSTGRGSTVSESCA